LSEILFILYLKILV